MLPVRSGYFLHYEPSVCYDFLLFYAETFQKVWSILHVIVTKSLLVLPVVVQFLKYLVSPVLFAGNNIL
jgi:hypothetical protein